MDEILKYLLQMGTGGVIGAIALYAWWQADKKNEKLQEKIYDLVDKSNSSRLELAVQLGRLADRIGAKS